MMISRTTNATTIHNGLNTHHQLHSMTLHSFNTKNTMNSTHMIPTPPDDFVSIYIFLQFGDLLFREARKPLHRGRGWGGSLILLLLVYLLVQVGFDLCDGFERNVGIKDALLALHHSA